MHPPPRLHVILARKASKAVILRRGPTKWFQLSLWQTDSDAFEHGQWLKGKIFPLRSDLSPDGSLLIYFAAKYSGGARRQKSGYADTYTAISRPPYFTALALWNLGDTWLGGGLFHKDKAVWLNAYPSCITEAHPKHAPKGLKIIPNTHLVSGDMAIYSKRLDRDGWILQPEGAFERTDWQTAWHSGERFVWHKRHPNADYHLLLEWHWMRSGDAFTYAIVDQVNGDETLLDDFTWADWDQDGRLVGARRGQILAANPADPNADVQVLQDFNRLEPEEISAPSWASRW